MESFGKISLGVGCGILAVLQGACGETTSTPPPPIPKPQPVYALFEGAPVWKAGVNEIATEPIRRLKYGEKVMAICDSRACQFTEGGVAVEVLQHTVAAQPPPPSNQYAIESAKVYGDPETGPVLKRKLRTGEKVEIRTFKAGARRVEIGEGEWVDFDVLRDHLEGAEERRARVKQEEAARVAEREEAAATARLEAKNRREFAKVLRTLYLDRGLDIKVSVSGSKADRLSLTFVLFDDVWNHRFEKNGDVDTWCNMGFKTINLSDGYDWGVKWTCKDG